VTSLARLRTASIVFGGWTVLALFYLPQTYLLNLRSPAPLSVFWAFIATAALFWIWALLTPLVLWLGRRFPFERGVIVRRLLVHLAAAILVTALHLVLLRYASMILMRGTPDYRSPVPPAALLVGYGATDIMVYWGLVAAGQALVYFRRYQDRELRLVEARLQALQTQLHPHFLFNTLNAIAELIYQDPRRAERTLTQLSDLLRVVLNRGEEHEVTLGEELAFLRGYITLQQTLLQERLTVVWNIEDETAAARVPTMILQPLVENAIRHGITPQVAGGTIQISAVRRNTSLVLTVDDDGVGLDATAAPGAGVGLPNTRARLEQLYGAAQTLAIEQAPGAGVRVSISLPYRTTATGSRT
jgi:two-component system LytT family sensor kinase